MLCNIDGNDDAVHCYGDVPDDPDPARRASIEQMTEQDRAKRSSATPRLLPGGPVRARIYEIGRACDVPTSARLAEEDCPNLTERGVALPDALIPETEALVRDPISYTPIFLRCYVPRHEIIFFDASNRVVARIEICFECAQIRTEPDVIWKRGDHGRYGAFRYLDYFEPLCKQAGLRGCDP